MEITTELAYKVIGMIGFVLYMLSYFELQIGEPSGAGSGYAVLNLSAASMVLIGLVHDFSLPSASIQVAWIVISLIALIRMQLLANKASAAADSSYKSDDDGHVTLFIRGIMLR